jgi:hypothetical protein
MGRVSSGFTPGFEPSLIVIENAVAFYLVIHFPFLKQLIDFSIRLKLNNQSRYQ